MKHFIHSVFYAFSLTGFLGCAGGSLEAWHWGGSSANLSSQAACLSDLQSTFTQTYHPFLTKNCSSCHATSHGSLDASVAFEAFQSRGVTAIEFQSTHQHGGNNLGAQLQPEIDRIRPAWDVAQTQFTSCIADHAQGTALFGSEALDIELGQKLAGSAALLEATRTDQSKWIKISWDVAKETALTAHAHLLRGQFSIEVQYQIQPREPSIVIGFRFRNPTLTLDSGQPIIEVGALALKLDGSEMSYFDTYQGPTMINPIMPGSSAAMANTTVPAMAPYETAANTTKVSLILKSVRARLSTVARPPSTGLRVGSSGTPTPTPRIIFE